MTALTPPDKLNNYDYKIIKYVVSHPSISGDKIARHFSKKINGINYRLDTLASYKYDRNSESYLVYIKTLPLGAENNAEYIREYSVTPFGEFALQNSIAQNKAKRVEFWKNLLHSKWVEILVSFVTAAITSANWTKISSLIHTLLRQFFD